MSRANVERYGGATAALLQTAYADEALKRRLTMEQRILLALADGEWKDGRELALTVSHRFGGYLHTLKEKGVSWEKRPHPDRPSHAVWWQYRLCRPDKEPGLF